MALPFASYPHDGDFVIGHPYNAYSSASACGVALEHGHHVRRPLGRELLVQVHAFCLALDQGDHPVVPRDVGGGEVKSIMRKGEI